MLLVMQKVNFSAFPPHPSCVSFSSFAVFFGVFFFCITLYGMLTISDDYVVIAVFIYQNCSEIIIKNT